MNHTRIKICGITRLEDAMTAVDAGADALGFMMYEGSPRFVQVAVARDIVGRLPPFVSAVGVFVNPSRARLLEICDEVPFDLLQFHGDEDDEFCREPGLGFIKGIRVAKDTDISRVVADYPGCRGVLLDAYLEGLYGGTGRTFDWRLVAGKLEKPVILAGGLNEANVCEAIRMVRPWAVDVSGGVEVEKGIKDPAKIRGFVNAVRTMA